MRIPISLLLLPLLLLCDRSAAGSFDHGSVGAEFEHQDGVPEDISLREMKPNQGFLFERSAVSWTSNSKRADTPCPEAATIAPCVCTVDDNNNIDLDCTSVESEDQLAAVFQQEFPVKELNEFSMVDNSALTVLGDVLNGVTFETIELYPGPFVLESVTDNFISDNKDTLTRLSIENSQLSSDTFPFLILPQMEVLTYINIFSSLLTWIPPITAPKIQTVRICYGLIDIIEEGTFPIHEWDTSLLLYSNQILTVEPGSFFFSDDNSAASNGVLSIRVQDNQIQSLQAGTFPLRNAMVDLYLASNQIASIEPGTFVLPEATDSFKLYLYLYRNQLTTFDEAVFGDLMPFIRELQLYDNPLSCGCDIAWLVLNSEFLRKVDATCADGTDLQDLDPQFYTDSC